MLTGGRIFCAQKVLPPDLFCVEASVKGVAAYGVCCGSLLDWPYKNFHCFGVL